MNTEKTWTWNKLYHYPPSTRSTTDGLRTYDVGNEKLPSVTTILGKTKSPEAQESIARWQAKVGMEQATRIKEQAASRGTNVHMHLEKYILGEGHLDLTPEGKIAKAMSDTIISKGFNDLYSKVRKTLQSLHLLVYRQKYSPCYRTHSHSAR